MMDPSAEQAVGQEDAAADWMLKPDEHAKALPPAAGALARVLETPAVGKIIADYRDNDAAAVAAQRRYKRVGRLGLYAATMATVVGALFLLPIFENWTDIRPYVSGVQIGALLTAFLASRWLISAQPFDRWMKQRAAAEIARGRLFDTVALETEPVREGELALLPLKLEYFRRYQLDVQRRYYAGRGEQHKQAIWRNNKWLRASFIMTVLSVILGVGVALSVLKGWGVELPDFVKQGLDSFSQISPNRLILALGVAASGFYGLGVARSLMDLDERNASRFETTSANLEHLTSTGLAEARQAAERGDEAAVLRFIEKVQQQISSEHREWVMLAGSEYDPDRLQYTVQRHDF